MSVLRAWLCDSLTRVYPRTPAAAVRRLALDAARGERLSFQVWALLQTAGIAPDSRLLRPIRSFESFPKTKAWILATRRSILRGRPCSRA
jgi:hypothetical protein